MRKKNPKMKENEKYLTDGLDEFKDRLGLFGFFRSSLEELESFDVDGYSGSRLLQE